MSGKAGCINERNPRIETVAADQVGAVYYNCYLTLELGRKEGNCRGGSTGAAICVALRYTHASNDDWMREKGFLK
jgi:hypothetical protein